MSNTSSTWDKLYIGVIGCISEIEQLSQFIAKHLKISIDVVNTTFKVQSINNFKDQFDNMMFENDFIIFSDLPVYHYAYRSMNDTSINGEVDLFIVTKLTPNVLI